MTNRLNREAVAMGNYIDEMSKHISQAEDAIEILRLMAEATTTDDVEHLFIQLAGGMLNQPEAELTMGEILRNIEGSQSQTIGLTRSHLCALVAIPLVREKFMASLAIHIIRTGGHTTSPTFKRPLPQVL